MPPSFDAPSEIDRLLCLALSRRASDLHFEPTRTGYEARFRVDGLLDRVNDYAIETGQMLVTRLMVLSKLLTYRLDIPQEGRLTFVHGSVSVDLRLSVMPTAKGLRAVVRLPADLTAPRSLGTLGLDADTVAGLHRFCEAPSGMLVVTGPAGSGKTTLLYALLEHLVAHRQGLSVVTLEDPVERLIEGVTQIEVTPFGQLTYERALRSMLRQDPQVLMLGEVRDSATALLAAQAAMTGHRLLCTLHADDPAAAIRRLLDMGVEPHQLTSSLHGIVAIRLLRKREGDTYQGRVPVAELVTLDDALRQAILASADADMLRKKYQSRAAHVTLRLRAGALVSAGVTDAAEVQRVLGSDGNG